MHRAPWPPLRLLVLLLALSLGACGGDNLLENTSNECSDGLKRCDDSCVDTDTDDQHCGRCGVACAGDETCRGEHGCLGSGCSNGVVDPDETDIDCGGACEACESGSACEIGSDCESAVCEGGLCLPPACDDEVTNGAESDTDCGGDCPGCDLGQRCSQHGDCTSTACDGRASTCSTWCEDGVAEGALCLVDDFERDATAEGWSYSSWRGGPVFSVEEGQGVGGSRAIAIEITGTSNDARWLRSLPLDLGSCYSGIGWVRAQDVVKDRNTGANLCVMDSWDFGVPAADGDGTYDYSESSFTFCVEGLPLEIAGRLGYSGNAATGKVWFDDIYLLRQKQWAGVHIILSFEAADTSAITDPEMAAWLAQLDDAYEAYEDLVGLQPYGGSQIRIASYRQYPGGWAVAGNPIRWHRPYVAGELARVADHGDGSFGILHEIGHDFDDDSGWVWDAEFSANFKMYYVVELLNLKVSSDQGATYYVGAELKENYGGRRNPGDPGRPDLVWRFIDIADTIGWDPFKATYRHFLAIDPADRPSSIQGRFDLFVERLAIESAEDILAMFTAAELAYIAGL
ncbi:MAG: hypothetical protein GY946_31710 [bacterium]|nr:hypothetical protein [bacterium]